MSNGCNRILHGCVGSQPVPRALTFRTTCGQDGLTVSQLIRLEWKRGRAPTCSGGRTEPAERRASVTSLHTPSLRPWPTTTSATDARSCLWSRRPALYRQHGHVDRFAHGFHTSSGKSLDGSLRNSAPTPNLPKRPPTTTPPGSPQFPPSRLTTPFPPKTPSRSKPPPPSGNKKRVNNVRDADRALPRIPVEESMRQKALSPMAGLGEQQLAPQDMSKAEKLARRQIWRRHELARREETRALARAKKLQQARHILDNLEYLGKETIAIELSQARQTAKQEVLERWTTNHVRELTAPILRRLNKVATRLSAVENSLTRLLGGMQEFRRNLLPRAKSTARQFEFIKNAGSVDPVLRETGYKMTDAAGILLPVSTLHAIALDLRERGLWKTHVDISGPTSIPNLFRGPKTPRVQRAMISILWLRQDLIECSEEISQELHVLRKIRTSYLLNSGLPEVFDFNARHTRLYLLSIQAVNNASRIAAHYHNLRLMVSLSTPFARRHDSDSVHHPKHQFLPLKLQTAAQDGHQIFKDDFRTPMAIGMKANIALQEAQLSNFRPVTIFISRMSETAELVDLVRTSTFLGLSTTTAKALQTLADELFAARRELYNLLDIAMLWRGTANMYLGIVHRPRKKSDLMLFVNPQTPSSDLPRPSVDCLPAVTAHSPPWQIKAELYPSPDAAIPIHFVTTPENIPSVLERFSNCRVLGVDTVLSVDSKRLPTGSSPLEYLVLASNDEVAIFPLGVMNPATLLLTRPFTQTLGNPAILKVGVNVKLQQEMLVEHFGIELVECHALDGMAEQTHAHENLDDPNFAIISSMVASSFGSPLPHLDITSAISNVGTKDPVTFFTHLSSRAYAVLQLYHLACAKVPTNNHSAAAAGERFIRSSAAFGPVTIHKSLEHKGSRERLLLARSPPLTYSRVKYMAKLAHAMARKAFDTTPCFNELKRTSRRVRPSLVSDVLSSLRAYFLFTAFSQNPGKMKSFFGVQQPASTILQIADKAQLPLHDGDRLTLDIFKRREPVSPPPEWAALLAPSSKPHTEQVPMPKPVPPLTTNKTLDASQTAQRSLNAENPSVVQERGAEDTGKMDKRTTVRMTSESPKSVISVSKSDYPSSSASTNGETEQPSAEAGASKASKRDARNDKVQTFYRSLPSTTTPRPTDANTNTGTQVITPDGRNRKARGAARLDAAAVVSDDAKETMTAGDGAGASRSDTTVGPTNRNKVARSKRKPPGAKDGRHGKGWWAG
ncbi:hypothetical protein HRR83_001586 [Exophiala dermatitidis]|uniref:Uncharacterized protein n=1 Tax=Exophiala dermatitidis (strain ATCC 34100 / CBS 525.76 / NIH/UT8656) TaxID=858893 RepID=H6C5Z6_EXODN|nr:uncharacterized protein HMPREF1120_07140 [Exophiala dermatitidis NIH/UT8656]KAJ4516258.1 hypothetical protein HRR73_004720 [Exophiala dermatitidis]EHY59142.1 hypothetical protein HMPREF1120_07140 [Exophiala dermatitidis NIH/UT8656]KAJ4526393.1 hypothetical protein HRR74_001590 [Exophiala dermatitidis]KAJ4532363.1 hypothetical protein HRR76_007361 [Exophiala dermatitidis]KAJ4546401.1 hypothetical protein HRR77_004935 [Exophiala dermatitidis]